MVRVRSILRSWREFFDGHVRVCVLMVCRRSFPQIASVHIAYTVRLASFLLRDRIGMKQTQRSFAATLSIFALGAIAAFGAQPSAPAQKKEEARPQTKAEAQPAEALPDNHHLVFVKPVPAKFVLWMDLRIFVKDGAGQERQLFESRTDCLTPRWSPDGKHVVFAAARDPQYDKELVHRDEITAWRAATNMEIWAVDSDGGHARRLTDHEAYDGSPAWSPDGRQIAFVSKREGDQTQVFVMDADGSHVRQVTRLKHGAGDPAWSPDSKQLLCMGREAEYFNIYCINVDGSGLKQLTNEKADERHPAWSPDGKTIVFGSSRPDYREAFWKLWAMDADGSNPRPLTRDKDELAIEFAPRFSRDGQRVYYSVRKRVSDEAPRPLFIRTINIDGTGQKLVMHSAYYGDVHEDTATPTSN
ncbi:MAG: hypothetical protein M3463_09910, partial [Verrucomicrobiota bacterium]|nr:hypothetical protein [Verrucomicrobiota bacterium]